MNVSQIKGLRSVVYSLCAVTFSVLVGCTGGADDKQAGNSMNGSGNNPVTMPDGPKVDACKTASYRAPLQMLNQFELRNTIHSLFGNSDIEVNIPTGPRGAYRGALLIDQLPNRWNETAWELAADAVKNVEQFTGCSGGNQNENCARTFISDFGEKVFRRPLSNSDVDTFIDLFQIGAEDDFKSGIEIVIAALLQDPAFLYRFEEGIEGSVDKDPGLRKLSGYEIAQRLSFNLWGTTPDRELLQAAKTGELDTSDGIRRHAERMLNDEKSAPMFADFVGQWLFTDHLGSIDKDAEKFPDYTPEIAGLLRIEIQKFVQDIVQNGGDFTELFTADYGFLNAKLAEFYGVDGLSGDEFVKTVMPAEAKRSGLLTFAGLMSVEGTVQGVSLSGSVNTYPIGRGRFIRERLACEVMAPPIANPADAPGVAEILDELVLQYGDEHHIPPRVFFDKITSANQGCYFCHRLLEPLGFALEAYGADGRARTKDVDGSDISELSKYVLQDDNGLDGEYMALADLNLALSESEAVKSCLTDHWYQYTVGRYMEEADHECFSQLSPNTQSVGSTSLKDLFLSVITSDLYRIREFK